MSFIIEAEPSTSYLPPARVSTLADLLLWQAEQQPEAPLLSIKNNDRSSTWTYEQVRTASQGYAANLRSLVGGTKDAVVGIWFDKSIELHLAIFATVLSGAGWLPFDPDAPSERVAVCLQDSAATVIICDRDHHARARSVASGTVRVVTLEELAQLPPTTLVQLPAEDDTAYMIYTSGSTGTPKGIAISHGAATKFAFSERSILQTSRDDVVWQGFSPAFDMFVEEVWVTIAGGGHLIIGTRAQCQDVPGLGGSAGVWAKAGVTLVNAVPTLINIMTSLDSTGEGLPSSVRLINLGGEACPPALVDRLSRPGLTITNTYGPTETTVTATYDTLLPGQPVTIGRPLPGYHALIVALDVYPPVPLDLQSDVEGQLCIGGPCLGKGYVNRPELTEAKYVAHPLRADERMYLTGDLVSLDKQGRLVFKGRIDTQVKHRGFRIELGEIEAALTECPLVQVAAVICAEAGTDNARLEAWIVLADSTKQDERAVTRELEQSVARLMAYMRPEAYFFLAADEMPRLPSGKVNAKGLHQLSAERAKLQTLPDPDLSFDSGISSKTLAESDAYSPSLRILISTLASIFPQHARNNLITPEADLFFDLGLHSLTAAILVSKIRAQAAHTPLASLSLADIYECRTAGALAQRYSMISSSASFTTETATIAAVVEEDDLPVTTARYWLCGIAQIPVILFLGFIQSLSLLVPYFVFDVVYRKTSYGWAFLATYGVFVTVPLFSMAIAIMGKWLTLGRAKEGEYPLYGVYYFRWWCAERLVQLVDQSVISDTPMYSAFYRLLGAKVGVHTHLSSMSNGAALDLITIEDDVVIGKDVLLSTSVLERGRLVLRKVTVKAGALIGSHTVLEGGSVVEAGAELGALSMVPSGTTIPSMQRWQGSPARYLGPTLDHPEPSSTRPSALRLGLHTLLCGFLVTFGLPILYLIPQVPGITLFVVVRLPISRWAQDAILAVPAATAYLVCVFVELVIVRRLVLGKMREGTYSTTSLFVARKWFVDRLIAMSLVVLHPVYATLYVVPYLRALGLKIGRGAEVSNLRGGNYELVEIGDESFVADNVLLGDTELRGNEVTYRKTTMCSRAFAGNSAMIPQGTTLASNTLVGVLSIAPDPKTQTALKEGESCFGSPMVRMPLRQAASVQHAEHLLFRPRWTQRALRLFIEGLRIWLPRWIVIFGIAYGLRIFNVARAHIGAVPTLLMLPFFDLCLFCLPALEVVVVLKWMLVGRYVPDEWPLWSAKVWLSEFCTSLFESLLAELFLGRLVGTPFLPPVLRSLGAKIGSRCTLMSHDMTEWDLVSVGDQAVLNMHAGPQTHLFEDRVMKLGRVTLGKRAVMKPYAICLPDSEIEEGTVLGSLSLVMKGEKVPAYQEWQGAPIVKRSSRRIEVFEKA